MLAEKMKRSIINTTRIVVSIVALALAWPIGGYIGSMIIPHTQLINKMETAPGKIERGQGVKSLIDYIIIIW